MRLAEYGCLDITAGVDLAESSNRPMVYGGFIDIIVAKLHNGNAAVAVKYPAGGELDHLVNEVRTISRIRHHNVVRFLGYVTDHDEGEVQHEAGIVYPWMECDLHEYLRSNPGADRYQLCLQVIDGLVYLHSIGIFHGDIRSRNVLISNDGNAMLTGFGGSLLEGDAFDNIRNFQFSPRFAAPERFGGSTNGWPTAKADIWSLGLTILVGISSIFFEHASYESLSS
ncbi:kinase-like protein [Ceratobasidium sp. AG-I]|nr:kinase-like protein [Ceratobasidium sp. AG-I]